MGLARPRQRVPDQYREVVTPARQRRHRNRTIAVAVGVVVVLALVAGSGYGWWRGHDRDRTWQATHTCPGMGAADPDLTWTRGECVGVVTEEFHAFMPGIAEITRRIVDENQRVRSHPEHLPYVRVAVFMPLTSRGSTDAMSEATILHSLQGAYTAQRRANTPPDIVSRAPLIQLALVNIGRNQEHWEAMAERVYAMARDPRPVVAAVGLGVSQKSTEAIGAWFSSRHFPLIGAALTANSLGGPSFFRTSPSNRDYVGALRGYLTGRRGPGTAVLFQDITPDDIYVQSLGAEFEAQLGAYIGTRRYEFKGSRVPDDQISNEFGNGRGMVCSHKADIVFFAGRDRDIGALVRNLNARGAECGHQRPLLILSAAPAYTKIQDDEALMAEMRRWQTTVVDASSAAPRQWIAGIDAPAGFAEFHQRFLAETYREDADLDDGYAIQNHDAVLTAVKAARLSVRYVRDRLPSPADVTTAIRNLNGPPEMVVVGAGGTLAFDDRSKTGPPATAGWPHGKKVPLNIIPFGGPVVPAYETP